MGNYPNIRNEPLIVSKFSREVDMPNNYFLFSFRRGHYAKVKIFLSNDLCFFFNLTFWHFLILVIYFFMSFLTCNNDIIIINITINNLIHFFLSSLSILLRETKTRILSIKIKISTYFYIPNRCRVVGWRSRVNQA